MQDTRSRTQELFILHSILFRLELKSWWIVFRREQIPIWMLSLTEATEFVYYP
jgi:hypothetical protein